MGRRSVLPHNLVLERERKERAAAAASEVKPREENFSAEFTASVATGAE